jgi:phage terminase small subunit
MAGKKNVLKTMQDLTAKQRKFVDIYVANFGNISKTEAARQAGYVAKDPSTIASKITNPNLNPHVVRYMEKKIAIERNKYANPLRSFKRLERYGDGAEKKNQFAAAINAEFRSGQLAGMYIDKKEITNNTLEGMNREQLEKRLSELEAKIGEAKNIIDVTPEEITSE